MVIMQSVEIGTAGPPGKPDHYVAHFCFSAICRGIHQRSTHEIRLLSTLAPGTSGDGCGFGIFSSKCTLSD